MMLKTIFQDSQWLNAVTLTERARTLNKGRRVSRGKSSKRVYAAEQKFSNWRNQPYLTANLFDRRLKIENLDETGFRFILGETAADLQKRLAHPPDWLAELESIFSESTETAANDGKTSENEVSGFSSREKVEGLFRPFLSEGRRRFAAGVKKLADKYPSLPFEPAGIDRIFVEKLYQNLAVLTTKTLALEVNIARLRDELIGDTPEERYRYFLGQLNNPEKSLPLLKEYSVLTRNAVVEVRKWVETSLEFLGHLCQDWEMLCKTFNRGESLGSLKSVKTGAGDSHRGGRSVAVVHFDSDIKLVYKPRSLAIDINFQNLLRWVNEKGEFLPFKIMNVLDRDSHGWVEFIENNACRSREEIECFYRRQGGFLALLYALEAVDFHAENLIADGEHPVLVDLESLFHPNVGKSAGVAGKEQSPNFAGSPHSVLRIGLLPQRLWAGGKNNDRGMDVSGFGGAGGQITPFTVPQWENFGTDQMRIVRRQVPIPGAKNRPSINGAEIDTLEFTNEVLDGFASMYRLLERYRDELLSKDGLLEKFAFCEIRYIARPTRFYSLLLHEAQHPDLLRNALDRDQFFDRLWAGVENQSYLARIIQSELNDLREGDVPIFSTRPTSVDIYDSRGTPISDYLETCGLEMAKERIRNLCDSDLQLQQWFIKASFASLATELQGATWGGYRISEKAAKVKNEELRELAKTIGDRLISLADKNGDFVSWTGVSLVGEKSWVLMPVGLDLYNGLPGIILFLAYLGRETGERKYTDAARAAFRTLRLQLEHSKSGIKSIGGFDGWGGLLYLFLHLGVIWNDAEILSQAEESVKTIRALINDDAMIDLLGGTAGAIIALHALHCVAPSDQIIETVKLGGSRLLAQAKQMENGGIGWSSRITRTPLSGISHGAAGIAYALFLAARLTGNKRFHEAALDAVKYERTLFSEKGQNWLDLREMGETGEGGSTSEAETEERFMTAWCHGAPGIGLARLAALPYTDDALIRQEIDSALKTTISTGFGHNHSLCHGDLGNLELLLQAQRTLESAEIKRHISRFSSAICKNIREEGWLCGLPLNVETPGFMTGLSGIGYQLLRLGAPKRLPSILILEAPVI